jgi:CRP/FNR family cyclic AMP-dependent transcriptional regulator
MTPVAAVKKSSKFNLKTFLSTINGVRTIVSALTKETIFAQGDSSDSVFYIQKGKIKLTVVERNGKEAAI